MGNSEGAARALRKEGYSIPCRPWGEPDVEFREPTGEAVRAILHSPCMVGAFIYGRRRLQLPEVGA